MRTLRDISLILLAVAAMFAGGSWAVMFRRWTDSDALCSIWTVVAGTAAFIVAWRVSHRPRRHRA